LAHKNICITIIIFLIFLGVVFPVLAEDSQNVMIETTRSRYYVGDTVKMEITVNEGMFNAIESVILIPPEDDRAFANLIVDSLIGGPENTFTNLDDALGPVNIIESCSDNSGTGGVVSLGGGYIVLDMGVNEEILNEPGNDLRVYERCKEYYLCDDPNPYKVYVSNDGVEWDFIGEGKGVAEFDISNTSLDLARYVKIIDAKKDTGGSSPGPEIDAVKALRFEYGHNIFANNIEDYYPGGKDNKHDKPIDGLIPDDEKYFSLGGGYIIFDMGTGTEVINSPGSDIRVYETNNIEPYSVYISQDMNSWTFVGDGAGITEFDISSTGMNQARYIQVSDGIKEEETNGDSPGADIDGVKALRFEKWPNKVLFNGGKLHWSEKSSPFSAKKTVEFVIPTTVERYGMKEFTMIVKYICAKESGPGFLQREQPNTIYIAEHRGHVIRKISIDVKTDGEKEEETPGFTSVFAFAGLLAVMYLYRQKK